MWRTLLVGVDGTSFSSAAIELGIQWARRFDALLVGIGVVDEPTIHGPRPLTAISPSYQAAYDRLLSDTRHHVEQSLEKFALRCGEAAIPCKLLEDEGVPWERILLEAQRYDVILLGRETHFRVGGEQRGCDTFEKVLRHSPRPVCVVPPQGLASRGGGVLIAYDGSVQAARALQAFVASGWSNPGPIHVVCVTAHDRVEAARTADRAVEYLRFHDLPAQAIPIVTRESRGKSLLHALEEQGADLMVMGAFGQSRITEFFSGSVTCTVIQETSVPLLLSS